MIQINMQFFGNGNSGSAGKGMSAGGGGGGGKSTATAMKGAEKAFPSGTYTDGDFEFEVGYKNENGRIYQTVDGKVVSDNYIQLMTEGQENGKYRAVNEAKPWGTVEHFTSAEEAARYAFDTPEDSGFTKVGAKNSNATKVQAPPPPVSQPAPKPAAQPKAQPKSQPKAATKYTADNPKPVSKAKYGTLSYTEKDGTRVFSKSNYKMSEADMDKVSKTFFDDHSSQIEKAAAKKLGLKLADVDFRPSIYDNNPDDSTLKTWVTRKGVMYNDYYDITVKATKSTKIAPDGKVTKTDFWDFEYSFKYTGSEIY